ncbi:hypothetical protein F5883DRAFT_721100 [Diaporthe sp. PMI_573]|nr:hypothetical protein F5883DRAFT_721100 [Diaporthaceae sp. PMI_573]
MQIDACSTELAQTLADKHPGVHWIVQMCGSEYERETGMLVGVGMGMGLGSGSGPWEKVAPPGRSGIEVQARMLHTALATWVQAELQSHLAVLRASPESLLLLAVQLRPDPGSVDSAVEAVACARSMTMAQLTGDTREMDLARLEQLVGRVRDSKDGGLLVLNKLHNSHCSTVALGIKYISRPQPPEPLAMVEPSLGWGPSYLRDRDR